MNRQSRTQLALGAILVLLGAWFLADRSIPAFHELVGRYNEWPFSLIGIGLILLLLGLVLGAPGMAVPAAIVAGVGCIFYDQETEKYYQFECYVWSPMLGFVGIVSALP